MRDMESRRKLIQVSRQKHKRKCGLTYASVSDLEVRDMGKAKVDNAIFTSVLRGEAIPGHQDQQERTGQGILILGGGGDLVRDQHNWKRVASKRGGMSSFLSAQPW